MKSPVIKRSIVIDRRKTSVSIEELFWVSLKEIARDNGMTLSKLVRSIQANRAAGSNLSSAIRVHILDCLQTRLRDLGANPHIPKAATPTSRASVPLRA